MMSNGLMGRHGMSGPGVSPLPGINTVLSHRDEMDSLMQWAPSMPGFDAAESTLFSDFLGPTNATGTTHLDSFPEIWDNSRREEEFLTLGTNLPEDEGRMKVEKSATILNISMDPVSWSRDDVLKWLRHSMRCNHSSPGMIVEEDWMVDGKGLCDMTIDDFIRRLPKDGDVLHSELDLWKTVYDVHIMGYNSGPNSIAGLFGEDYGKDSGFPPTYANLETAEAFPSLHHIDPKYLAPPPNLLQADPNLQQVTINRCQLAFDSKLNSYCEYNNNTISSNNNNNNISREQPLYSVIKAEQLEDIHSSADDNSWLMHNTVTSSTNFYHEHKPKFNQRKWSLTRVGSDGVSSAMPDVVATATHRRGKRTITLWQFLKELLVTSFPDPAPIRWIDREKGIFKIEDSVRVAKLWGERKNRPAMNYDKLSRSIRQYYKKGIIKKTSNSKRLVYQFCPEFL